MFERRITFVTVIMSGAIISLIAQLGNLQLVHGRYYREMSQKNRIRLENLPAYRGKFFDRNKVPLAVIKPTYNAAVTLEDVGSDREKRKKVYARLERLLGMKRGEVAYKIGAGRTRPFIPVVVKRNISSTELADIEEQGIDLPGIGVQAEPVRGYIFNEEGAHIFGYMGLATQKQLKDSLLRGRVHKGDVVGRTGLERIFNSNLIGIRGARQIEVNVQGRTLNVMAEKPPLPGNNIVLTIDHRLQELAERIMKGKRGSVIAINPQNGEILAMVSSPSYNPNLFSLGISAKNWKKVIDDPRKVLLDRSIQSKLPPGSIFKPIMALAGLNEGIIDKKKIVECKGFYRLGSHRYECWKRNGHGEVGLHSALIHSCNVYFYTVGHELGINLIHKYATMFGLGELTGIEKSNEKKGLVPSSEWKRRRYHQSWFPGETILVSIGQGYLLATPLQLANMMCAIANRGTLYTPRLVSRITNYQGKLLKEIPPKIIRTIDINPGYFETVREALHGVVNDKGTGQKAAIEGFDVAGKTGTAQVIKKSWMAKLPEEKIPKEFRDHAWFASFAPCRKNEKAEIVVTVMVENGGHGGSECAPIARKIILKYFELSGRQI
ncbi:MAG: penicillin-binding protein 2 [bacterium]